MGLHWAWGVPRGQDWATEDTSEGPGGDVGMRREWGCILRTDCLGHEEGEPWYLAGSTHSMARNEMVVLRAGKFILLVSSEVEEVDG